MATEPDGAKVGAAARVVRSERERFIAAAQRVSGWTAAYAGAVFDAFEDLDAPTVADVLVGLKR